MSDEGELEGQLIHETGRAWLVLEPDVGGEFWLPKSQVRLKDIYTTPNIGDNAVWIVPQWLLRKNNL